MQVLKMLPKLSIPTHYPKTPTTPEEWNAWFESGMAWEYPEISRMRPEPFFPSQVLAQWFVQARIQEINRGLEFLIVNRALAYQAKVIKTFFSFYC